MLAYIPAAWDYLPLPPDQYWATAAPEDIGQELMAKVDTQAASDTALSRQRDMYYRAALYYFGRSSSGMGISQAMTRGGDNGELALVRVNHARALVQTLLNLILSAKVIWDAQANNKDYQSRAQTILASQVLEQYWKDYYLASTAALALEQAIVFGDGFVYAPWDPDKGAEVQGVPKVDAEGNVIGLEHEGDFDFRNPLTWDVFRDPYKRSYDELDWVIVHLRENKFNLIAKNPELKDGILGAAQKVELKNPVPMPGTLDTDDISVYHFYHKKTPACPTGRETFFVDDRTILHDGPLSYDRIPLYRVRAADIFGSPYAYTQFFEILGPQELVDSLETCIATNQTTFGTQMIAVPTGTAVSPESFGGMKMLEYPAGMAGAVPQALQLTKSPPEIFQHLKDMVGHMELLMGLNSTVRGVPESGEQSGSALALLSNQAKQQSSTLEGDFYKMLRMLGTGIVEGLRKKATEPRKVAIAGKANRFLVQQTEYTPSEDFSNIHHVLVDIGNPMQQTTSGRRELADMYLQMLGPGRLQPEQIDQVIETGRLDPMTGGIRDTLLLVVDENEKMREGQPQPVLADDDHPVHFRGHQDELANPEVRANPAALQAFMQHQSEHWNLYLTSDPRRLLTLGIQPPPVMAPPALPPGAPGPEGAPPGMSGPPPQPGQPSMPEMPTDKSTGEQVAPAGPPITE